MDYDKHRTAKISRAYARLLVEEADLDNTSDLFSKYNSAKLILNTLLPTYLMTVPKEIRDLFEIDAKGLESKCKQTLKQNDSAVSLGRSVKESLSIR